MEKIRHNILNALLMALTSVMILMSCGSDDPLRPETADYPIAFAPVATEQEAVTRSATTPLTKDFIIYGYKHVGANQQTVFDGYKVKYSANSANTSADNTHNYYYVGIDNQTLKYWDFSASEYHFWGLYKESEELADFTETYNNKLTINNLRLRSGQPDPVDEVLFSSLSVRYPVSPEVVRMEFNRPYAKLRVQFYTTEQIEDASDNIELSQISFAPDPSATSPLVNKVYGEGNVRVNYPLVTDDCNGNGSETVEVTELKEPHEALLFKNVTLTTGLGISTNTAVTAAVDDIDGLRLDDMPGTSLKSSKRRAGEIPGEKYFYYPLPMGEKNPAFIMSAHINGDMEWKNAVVPATFMQWKPNYLYTYIFKITDASKKIELYDVKIDPWKYGGSQEEEWNNW